MDLEEKRQNLEVSLRNATQEEHRVEEALANIHDTKQRIIGAIAVIDELLSAAGEPVAQVDGVPSA